MEKEITTLSNQMKDPKICLARANFSYDASVMSDYSINVTTACRVDQFYNSTKEIKYDPNSLVYFKGISSATKQNVKTQSWITFQSDGYLTLDIPLLSLLQDNDNSMRVLIDAKLASNTLYSYVASSRDTENTVPDGTFKLIMSNRFVAKGSQLTISTTLERATGSNVFYSCSGVGMLKFVKAV